MKSKGSLIQPKCDRCKGFMVMEKVYTNSFEPLKQIRCINCGNRITLYRGSIIRGNNENNI